MKTILLTLGDPGGLGPELAARHFPSAPPLAHRILIIGPESGLLRLGDPFWTRIHSPGELTGAGPGVFLLEPSVLAGLEVPPGEATVEGGRCAGASLEAAVELLASGMAHGLVTCPLNKAMLQVAGYDFPGHTEFLAHRLGADAQGVCMHLGGPKLKVSLVTTHPPLSRVPSLVTGERIVHCLKLTQAHLASIGAPGTIGVCGLNPHAGEFGRIGREDEEVVAPAVERAKAEGVDCAGPIPADTLFHFAAKGRYAGVLAMYHDQGLGPLKLLHFSEAVNVTLGLPFPRTSPDHGTGYDLVGKGTADLTSFRNALGMMERMVERSG